MTLLALYLLATVDGGFCGFRAAAGRSGLIDKTSYYRRAMLRGAAWVQLPACLAGLLLLAFLQFSAHRSLLAVDLVHAGERMLWVYVPYATVVFCALLLRWFPSVDIRSATSVMIFGPLTALRPVVCVAGVLYGIFPADTFETRTLGCFVLLLMLGIEPFLNTTSMST